ncbi:MAG TPA: EVE domain-containing protein [Bryobacteraceae bacterium]|jgi:predicted RNA-binding protein with PUA-like domain|nr:EVE domain-containing protein [Bryobacteraceae bacterium]
MNYFLAKSEPQVYALNDLERDQKTTWDGVKNPQALQAIRAMKVGDRVFFYHSGGQSAVVGLAKVTSAPRPDPKNEKLTVVDLEFVAHLDPPVTLAEIKAEPKFSDWLLVRNGRLSTMTAPTNFVEWMRKRYPKVKI